jgi:hypothetical protein
MARKASTSSPPASESRTAGRFRSKCRNHVAKPAYTNRGWPAYRLSDDRFSTCSTTAASKPIPTWNRK